MFFEKSLSSFLYSLIAELASGWDFFGIPDPKSRSRGFGIGIFYFGLDQKIPKIPKSRGSGSGFENPEKIPSEKSRKSRNPRDRDLFFRDIPGISRSGGAQEQKTQQHPKKHFYILKTKNAKINSKINLKK